MTSKVVAVVGMSGTGKSVAVEYLCDKLSAERIYFGGVVIEDLQRQGRAVTEDNEAIARSGLRQQLGMSAMAIRCLPRILECVSRTSNVVIDGLYSYAEYTYLTEKLPVPLVTVAVHAEKTLRVQRLSERPVRPLSKSEVLRRDKREIEEMEKGGPIALADYHLLNNESINCLYHQIDGVVKKLHDFGASAE